MRKGQGYQSIWDAVFEHAGLAWMATWMLALKTLKVLKCVLASLLQHISFWIYTVIHNLHTDAGTTTPVESRLLSASLVPAFVGPGMVQPRCSQMRVFDPSRPVKPENMFCNTCDGRIRSKYADVSAEQCPNGYAVGWNV